ncbi:MAG TPA: superinfection immunity protein [Acidobacteriaceae bacterium]|nr:superinfection immunity protein [Acidobacteriaceae bacterium]
MRVRATMKPTGSWNWRGSRCVPLIEGIPEASMASLFGVAIYFLPSLIAAARHTHNATGIFLFNLFLGWTGIGWIIALLVAICSSPYYYYCYPYPPDAYLPPRRWY